MSSARGDLALDFLSGHPGAAGAVLEVDGDGRGLRRLDGVAGGFPVDAIHRVATMRTP